jgi:hypothetical protein
VEGGKKRWEGKEEVGGKGIVHTSGEKQSFTFSVQKYKVDLGLWGHYHNYQRTCPVYNHTCTTSEMTHILIGSGGRVLEQDYKSVLQY